MLTHSTPLKYQEDCSFFSQRTFSSYRYPKSKRARCDDGIIEVFSSLCVFFLLHLSPCTSAVSATRIDSFSIPHTHVGARRMHPSCIWACFLHLILPFLGPQDSIGFLHSSHALTLISDHAWIILARSRLHKCCVSLSSLTSQPPLKLLFCRLGLFCRHPFVHLMRFASIMDLFFFLVLWDAEPECLSAREGESTHYE